jgi:hypothetical protein
MENTLTAWMNATLIVGAIGFMHIAALGCLQHSGIKTHSRFEGILWAALFGSLWTIVVAFLSLAIRLPDAAFWIPTVFLLGAASGHFFFRELQTMDSEEGLEIMRRFEAIKKPSK